MRKQRRPNRYNAPKTTESLLGRIHLLLGADLEDEIIGRHAYHLLKTAEKFGFKFQNPAQEASGCGACLFISLRNAEQEIRSDRVRKPDGQEYPRPGEGS